MRDAELIAPGTVENAIRERVEAGQEPTKAAVKDAVEAVTKPFVANNTGNNEWYTPAAYLEAARDVVWPTSGIPALSANDAYLGGAANVCVDMRKDRMDSVLYTNGNIEANSD